tara:strand:+ start:1759 stop:2043 length:285 start_codon:yes stop_codon:yes gene_type:complete
MRETRPRGNASIHSSETKHQFNNNVVRITWVEGALTMEVTIGPNSRGSNLFSITPGDASVVIDALTEASGFISRWLSVHKSENKAIPEEETVIV